MKRIQVFWWEKRNIRLVIMWVLGINGIHDWFSVGSSNVLGWFDDLGGDNVSESF